jgi:hypothetical protein
LFTQGVDPSDCTLLAGELVVLVNRPVEHCFASHMLANHFPAIVERDDKRLPVFKHRLEWQWAPIASDEDDSTPQGVFFATIGDGEECFSLKEAPPRKPRASVPAKPRPPQATSGTPGPPPPGTGSASSSSARAPQPGHPAAPTTTTGSAAAAAVEPQPPPLENDDRLEELLAEVLQQEYGIFDEAQAHHEIWMHQDESDLLESDVRRAEVAKIKQSISKHATVPTRLDANYSSVADADDPQSLIDAHIEAHDLQPASGSSGSGDTAHHGLLQDQSLNGVFDTWRTGCVQGLEALEDRAAALRMVHVLGQPPGVLWEDRHVSLVALNQRGVGRSLNYVHWKQQSSKEARIVHTDFSDGVTYLKYPAFEKVIDLQKSGELSFSVVHPAIGVHVIRRTGRFRAQVPEKISP